MAVRTINTMDVVGALVADISAGLESWLETSDAYLCVHKGTQAQVRFDEEIDDLKNVVATLGLFGNETLSLALYKGESNNIDGQDFIGESVFDMKDPGIMAELEGRLRYHLEETCPKLRE
jgi:hypothetical protein